MIDGLDGVTKAAAKLQTIFLDAVSDPVGNWEQTMFASLLVAVIVSTAYTLIASFTKTGSAKHDRRIAESWDRLKEVERFVSAGKYQQAFHLIRYTIDPYTFEEMLLSAFERSGAGIVRNARYSGDGGIDGRIYYQGSSWLIQAKRYRGHIRLSDLKKHRDICEKHNAKGIFIHAGRTGKGSAAAGRSAGVVILSGHKLMDFLAGHAPLEGILHG